MGALTIAASVALCGCAAETTTQDPNVVVLHASGQKDGFLVQAATLTLQCGYEYFRLFAPDGKMIPPQAPLPAEADIIMRMYGPRDEGLTTASMWNVYSVLAAFDPPHE